MDHHGAVVVGLGDAEHGVPELDWAAADAATRGVELHIVRAYHLAQGTVPWDNSFDRSINAELHTIAQRRLTAAVDHVRRGWPELTVRPHVASGRPSDVLRGESRTAAVTVVGSRHRGALGSALLGSTSTALAASAEGPVVVVRGPAGDPAEEPAVVVGVDGSEPAEAALAFAFDHASRHKRPLRAVYCWRPDVLATMEWRHPAPPPERAGRWLAESLAGWSERYPDVDVHRSVVREHAVEGLLLIATTQDLLVVGTHAAHPRIASMLGSVAQGVLHHSTSPVAVIPS